MQETSLYQFNKNSKPKDWNIVDDIVMGGRSSGGIRINNDGYGVFSGNVSLENNGGFSSIKYRFNKKTLNKNAKIILKIKGDGKPYQFRIKSKSSDKHSYISHFNTGVDWEMIKIDVNSMYPSYRGKQLNLPNDKINSFEEVSIFIGNKRNETFKLEIDNIKIINE